MKTLTLAVLLSVALIGCSDKGEPTAPATKAKPAETPRAVTADLGAGKAIAEKECRACHGLDGKGVAPGIPHIGGQRERYLLASIKEYKGGKRTHAALRDMTGHMSEAEVRNVTAYYAGLPSVMTGAAKDGQLPSPHEQGKELAAACAKCHGEDGNSKTPGIPSLAGQQPHYLVTAIQEYHQGERKTASMKSMLRASGKVELEKLALYFASQTPAERPAPPFGDPAGGEPLTAMCGGCHGSHGVSTDAATPTLAGQDARYLFNSIKEYRKNRQHWGMQRFVAGLGDKDVQNIAAFYSVQKSQPADRVPTSTRELADKCNRCHDADNPAMTVPILKGQDKDYLVMALRAYRDGKRESSTMHNMSSIYGNAIIESIASLYAGQPAK